MSVPDKDNTAMKKLFTIFMFVILSIGMDAKKIEDQGYRFIENVPYTSADETDD